MNFLTENLKSNNKVNGKNKILPSIVKGYLLYATVFGAVIFAFHNPNITNYKETHPVDRLQGESIGQDRVALVDERYLSGLARINLIENAKDTLDISYYTLHEGKSTDIFFGSILNAADRGVKVRILLDGVFHNLKGDLKEIPYICYAHPNIELKYYEPFSILKPWTWNNRLHDKIIIVDNELAMIGGRNIGDKYFAKDGYEGVITNDRDVVVLNTDKENISSSVISQFENYFNKIWNHKYSKYPLKKLKGSQKKEGEEKAKYLQDYVKKLKETKEELFNYPFDWEKMSYPTNKVTLIHNPIERLNKEPWCWYEITNLAKKSKKSIFVQSPYIVPTKKMLKHIDVEKDLPEKIDILTNSLATNANPMGTAGTMRFREKIVELGANLYEYQGVGSIHAKSYIFDDRISLVGSFNLDARSTYLSTETMVVIDSEEFAGHFKDEIKDNYIVKSLKVDKDYKYMENPSVKAKEPSTIKVIIIKLLSILAYLFDFMI